MLKQEIKKLSKKYEVEIIFEKMDDLGGYIFYDNPKTIFITENYKNKRADFLRVFFHELGHIYCIRNKKWKAYHSSFTIYKDKKTYYTKYLHTALKAEKWIDNWAAKELKKHDHRVKYDFPFSNKHTEKWFRETHLNSIKKLKKEEK